MTSTERDAPSSPVPAMRPLGSPRRRGSWQAPYHEPRGSAPRERDHRGGDHPVPSRTRQLSPPSPRVLQREAAGGQGVALAEGAFLYMRAPRAPRAPHAPGEVAASRPGRSALRRIRPPPGIVGRAGTAGGVVPCGPLRVLGHCPAGRSDRRRALGRRFFYLYEAPARFAGPGRVPAGGSPPVGLSVFRGRSLPEGLREGFLLDRSCARHVPEELRGLPAGLLALTWTSNLTAVDRFALSRHSAVSKRFCPGRPPLWCRRYVPRVSEVRGGICSFDLIMSMLLLACVVGSAIVAFGATLFGEHFR